MYLMSGKTGSELTPGLLFFILIVGGGLYLLMEKPAIFWLVFIPIMVLIIMLIVKTFKRK